MPLRFDPRPVFAAPPELTNPGSTGANQWFGRAAVSSDTAGVSFVASTQLVGSDSILSITLQAHGQVGSGAFTDMTFVVATISPANFFKAQTANSVAAVGSFTAMWVLFNPRGTP